MQFLTKIYSIFSIILPVMRTKNFAFYGKQAIIYSNGMIPQTPVELLETGLFKEIFRRFMNDLHEKAGLHYLWRNAGSWNNDSFQPVITRKIDTPYDMANLKIGATSTFMKPFLDKVGGTMVIIPPPEAYTSLERGVVDGFVWPLVNSNTPDCSV